MRIFILSVFLFLTVLLYGQIGHLDTLTGMHVYPKVGPYQEFYKSGKIKVQGTYAKVDSIECINCFDTGLDKKVTKAFLRIMRIGEWKEYHENGQLKSVGAYKGIHETHITTWIDDQGKKIGPGKFAPGGVREDYVKDKKWQYFNTAGQLTHEEFYYNGSLVDEHIYEKKGPAANSK